MQDFVSSKSYTGVSLVILSDHRLKVSEIADTLSILDKRVHKVLTRKLLGMSKGFAFYMGTAVINF